MKIPCSEINKETMARSKEQIVALMKRKALIKSNDYKIKALVDIKEVHKMETAVLETAEG